MERIILFLSCNKMGVCISIFTVGKEALSAPASKTAPMFGNGMTGIENVIDEAIDANLK